MRPHKALPTVIAIQTSEQVCNQIIITTTYYHIDNPLVNSGELKSLYYLICPPQLDEIPVIMLQLQQLNSWAILPIPKDF